MSTTQATGNESLWLSIEGRVLDLGDQDLSGGNLENALQTIAGQLDEAGHNVTKHGGNMMALRKAMGDRAAVGRPMMDDLKSALAAFTLEDVADTNMATVRLVDEIGAVWPKLKEADRRPDILAFVEQTKLDRLVDKAKAMDAESGIRLLLAEGIAGEVIIERMGISQDELARVEAAVAAEQTERVRVLNLLEDAEDKSDEDKVKHLVNSDVAVELILELAGVDEGVVKTVQRAMEEELKEKQRLAEEAAAKKAAEAAGPPLEEIPNDEMLEYIESIREILEFSDVEKEIRSMCEQSSIPQCLVDVAVSEPDKLDELEEKAEG